MSTPTRCFLAIPLPTDLRQAVDSLQSDLRTDLPEVRWTRPDNLHLTLRFFGEIPQEMLEKISSSVLSVDGWQKPFRIDIRGLGVFPDIRRPRVLWLGLSPTTELQALYRSCQATLATAGIVPEQRPFSPHLTIGRFRRRSPNLRHILSEQHDRLIDTMVVDRLVLYQSKLHRNGAEHIPLLETLLEG